MTSFNPPNLDPDLLFLLQLVSRASDNDKTGKVVYEDMNEGDEERLIEFARRHGVRAYVARYGGLKGTTLDQFPALNIQNNLGKTGELVRILKCLESESLRVIPYKGPALAVLAYGDLAMREFGDLDLLIERGAFEKAHVRMLDLGYEPEIRLEAGQWVNFIDTTNVLAYWHPEKEISVELHWELSPRYLPYPYDFETLYGRREPSYPGGREVMTLSGGDLLLFLCMHGAKHGWERLSWIIDVGGLISRHPKIEWDRMIVDARYFGMERVIGLGLSLARKVTKVELPGQAGRLIDNDPIIIRLTALVIEWLGKRGRPSPVAHMKILLQLQKRQLDKARMLYRIMLTPSVADWRTVKLPKRLTGMYGLIRPIRLLVEALKSAKG